MTDSFRAFLREGVVHGLTLDSPRSEVILCLGKPPNWTGKPPCFGEHILDHTQAPVLHYFGDALAVCGLERVEEFLLAIDHCEDGDPFGLGNSPLDWTRGSIASWLESEGYQFTWNCLDGGEEVIHNDEFAFYFLPRQHRIELPSHRKRCWYVHRFRDAAIAAAFRAPLEI